MTHYDLVVRAQRIITPDGTGPGAVAVSGGRIAAIGPFDANFDAENYLELAGDEVLIPGLVDSHVHINEPGRTQWEGFATATRAAAAGGITTVIDMPLNSIPSTTSVDALATKKSAATGKCSVDVGFWGGAVPGSTPNLEPLWDAGVFGFKCFLADSGVEEYPPLNPAQLREALTELARIGGMMIVHAEDGDVLDAAPQVPGQDYDDFLASRPRDAENRAIADLIAATRETGARVHVLHLSSSDAVAQLAAARAEGLPITVETCPHYLFFNAETIPDGSTQYKCCPPIREKDNQDALWQALADGVIDIIVSDHSPCTADLKRMDVGDFAAAWGGIASVQLTLPAIWTAAQERGIDLPQVIGWMSQGPADLVGLPNKGRIAVGADADFAVFAPDALFDVHAESLQHRNAVTPYDGRKLSGVVRATYLAGRPVDTANPAGRFLSRP